MSHGMPLFAHHPHAGASLLAHGNAPHGCNNARIPHFLFTGLQKPGIVSKNISRIPELNAIPEKFDYRLAGMVAIILVDEQIHGSLPENPKSWGIIAPSQCVGIDIPEWLWHEEAILADQLRPRLNNVFFAHSPVNPPGFGQPVLRRISKKLYIQRGSWQQLMNGQG